MEAYKSMHKKIIYCSKVILVNILLIIFFTIIAEIIFGNWFKNKNYGNLLIPKYNVSLIKNPPYKSPYATGVFSRDKNGFRANNYNLDSINILVLGGSTTEERDVDDNYIWTKVLEKNFTNNNKQKVLNAGLGGQTSYGHIQIFDLWFSRYEELKPEKILVYIGINDALYMLENITNNKSNYEGRLLNSSNRDTLIYRNSTHNYIQYIKNNSAFHLLYLIIKGNYLSRQYKINYNTNNDYTYFPYAKKINIKENIDLEIKNFLEYYKNNLKILSEIANKYDSQIIFITQTIAKDHWLNKYLSLINTATIDFCDKNFTTCIDLHNIILMNDNEDFYDGIHTTPIGSKKIGDMIYKEIIN